MHPEILPSVPSYGMLILLGFIAGMVLFRHLLRQRELDLEHHTDMILLVFLAAFAGARVFHLIFGEAKAFDPYWRPIAVWDGGLSFQGGLLAGAATAFFIRKKVHFRIFLDAASIGLVLGHLFGRIGCLTAGCCWGKSHASWPGGLRFPAHSAAGLTYESTGRLPPLIPVQVYEVVFLAVLLLAMLRLFRREPGKKHPGTVFAMYLILYGTGRFFLEMLRGDPGRGFLFELHSDTLSAVRELPTETAILLSIPQVVSLLMLVCGIFLFRKWRATAQK